MSPGASRSEVIRIERDDHLPILVEFLRAMWSPNASLEQIRNARTWYAARNPIEPGAWPPTWLFLHEGRPIGHLSTIPILLDSGAGRGRAHWLKGFAVLPEHRNGPVGGMLVRAAARELDTLLATVVDRAPRRLFEAFKLRDLGALPDHVRILRPARVLRQLDPEALGLGLPALVRAGLRVAGAPGVAGLTGGVVGLGFAARARAAAGARDLSLELDPKSDAGFDDLWQQIAASGVTSPARDAGYFRRRYGESYEDGYRVVALRRGGALVAWAGIRQPSGDGGDPRLRGVRMAILSDVVVRPDREPDALAVLRAAETVAAREEDADALLCSATHPGLRGWLRRRAYLPVGGRVHLMARGPKGGPPLPESLADWWLTRADGGADEGL